MMSKYKALILSLIFGLLLSSCIFSKNDTDLQSEDVSSSEQSNLTGTLKYIGSYGYKGSHYFLEMEDGSIVYVIHDEGDEALSEYKDQNVEVEGSFIDKSSDQSEKDIFQIEKISLLTKGSQNEDASKSSMAEYTNYNLGFKFKLENDLWAVKNETDNSVTLKYIYSSDSTEKKSQVVPSINISILPDKLILNTDNKEEDQDNPEDTNEPSALYSWVEQNNPGYVLSNYNVGPDKVNAVKVNVSESKSSIYLSRTNEIYLIEFQSPNLPEFTDSEMSFYDIISTFQFIAKSYATDSTLISISTDEVQEEEPDTIEGDDSQKDYSDQISKLSSSFPDFASKYIQGVYQIQSYEFVKDKNYAYIIYKDESKNKKILLSYDESLENIKVEAYFEEGESTTWQKIEGEDTVSKDPKDIVKVDETGKTSNVIELKEGYSYLESKAYKFRIQYPSSWYYVSLGNGSYGFSNESFDAGEQKVLLEIVAGSIDENSKDTKVTQEEVILYAKRSETESYKISGPAEFQEQMQDMMDSVEGI